MNVKCSATLTHTHTHFSLKKKDTKSQFIKKIIIINILNILSLTTAKHDGWGTTNLPSHVKVTGS